MKCTLSSQAATHGGPARTGTASAVRPGDANPAAQVTRSCETRFRTMAFMSNRIRGGCDGTTRGLWAGRLLHNGRCVHPEQRARNHPTPGVPLPRSVIAMIAENLSQRTRTTRAWLPTFILLASTKRTSSRSNAGVMKIRQGNRFPCFPGRRILRRPGNQHRRRRTLLTSKSHPVMYYQWYYITI